MKHNKLYIIAVGVVFAALTIVLDTLPRSTFSPLEKRDLDTIPAFSWTALKSGAYTEQVSHWFSDTEPYRDVFMTMSMNVKKLLSLSRGEETITYHASDDEGGAGIGAEIDEVGGGEDVEGKDYVNHNAKEKAKIANNGIVVVGSGPNVRALVSFGGEPTGGTAYSEACNLYKKEFPECRVYCMVIPTAIEYYCPDAVKEKKKSQLAVIQNINRHLDPGIDTVDVYTMLQRHADEDIYLRTDHHWSPLGGYYGAKAFAKAAGVPFLPLTAYNERVVHGYVGSMYGYSKDIAVKNAPEDFVYYEPKDSSYKTTYIIYQINRDYQITSERGPIAGSYFYKQRDGSGNAYCTFLGGDTRITHVTTSTKNGRRLIIFKDSFGNALGSNLFGSFEDIHIVDSRYFNRNMRKYIRENKITDILFANNIFSAYSPSFIHHYREYLDQEEGIIKGMPDDKGGKSKAESKSAEKEDVDADSTMTKPSKSVKRPRRHKRRR